MNLQTDTSLTIPNGSNVSNVRSTKGARHITIYAPAALTQTITLRACNTESGTFTSHQSGGQDITIAAAKSVTVTPAAFSFFKLQTTSGNEGADRVFIVELGWDPR